MKNLGLDEQAFGQLVRLAKKQGLPMGRIVAKLVDAHARQFNIYPHPAGRCIEKRDYDFVEISNEGIEIDNEQYYKSIDVYSLSQSDDSRRKWTPRTVGGIEFEEISDFVGWLQFKASKEIGIERRKELLTELAIQLADWNKIDRGLVDPTV